jgi:hypothetical protein
METLRTRRDWGSRRREYAAALRDERAREARTFRRVRAGSMVGGCRFEVTKANWPRGILKARCGIRVQSALFLELRGEALKITG